MPDRRVARARVSTDLACGSPSSSVISNLHLRASTRPSTASGSGSVAARIEARDWRAPPRPPGAVLVVVARRRADQLVGVLVDEAGVGLAALRSSGWASTRSRKAVLVVVPSSTVSRSAARVARDRLARGWPRGRSPWRSSDRTTSCTSWPSSDPVVDPDAVAGGEADQRAADRSPARSRRRRPRRRPGTRSRDRACVTSSWPNRQRLPGGDPELLGDDVDPGHQLGHRMLHLQPRVHLEEVEVAARASATISTVPAET